MLTLEARIETESASRYLVRFCKHATSMGRERRHGPRVHLGGPLARREVQVRAECSDGHGTVTFDPWGYCSLEAGAKALTVRLEAADEECLHRIQEIVSRDLSRFSGGGELVLDWRCPPVPGTASDAGPAT